MDNVARPGFRQQPKPTKKHSIDELNQMVQNLSMVVQVTQALLKNIMQNSQKVDSDMANTMGVLNDLQYRSLALIEASGIDKNKLEDIAEKLKEKDYSDASDKEDQLKGYLIDDEVKENSILIISSECESAPDKAIFRSKFKLSEATNPKLNEVILGKKVNDKVKLEVAGNEHEITILGIRKELPKEEPIAEVKTEVVEG